MIRVVHIRTTKHLDAYHKARNAATNVHDLDLNQIHQDSLSPSEKVAQAISDHVGTMIFCYVALSCMLAYMLTQSVLLPALHLSANDPYPFSLLFFLVSGFFQTFMLPILQISANIQARRYELEIAHEREINKENAAHIAEVLTLVQKGRAS